MKYLEQREVPHESRRDQPTVLVIQARMQPERINSEQEKLSVLAETRGVSLIFVNPLTDNDHPWEDPKKMLQGADGVLFTGSSDIDLTVQTEERDLYLLRATDLAKASIKKGSKLFNPTPVFAICLGHQMIHQAAGGKLERDPAQMETGTTSVLLSKKGTKEPYLADVRLTRNEEGSVGFLEFFGHKDTVVKRARGFKQELRRITIRQ